MNKFRCCACGCLFNDGDLDVDYFLCPSCGGRLEEGLFEEPKKEEAKSNWKTWNENQNKKSESIVFGCINCNSNIRINFPLKSMSFNCPSCQRKYGVKSTGNFEKVYVIYPKSLNNENKYSSEKQKIPEEIIKALHVFELNKDVTFEEVKAIYRKRITQYHPDKVSHLGEEFKRLAEEKSKFYNEAYVLIQGYFRTC